MQIYKSFCIFVLSITKNVTEMKTLNVLAAFIGGAIAGAALGILFAPEKCEDTRDKIAQALRDHGVKLSKEDFEKLVKDIQSKISKKNDPIAEVVIDDEI